MFLPINCFQTQQLNAQLGDRSVLEREKRRRPGLGFLASQKRGGWESVNVAA